MENRYSLAIRFIPGVYGSRTSETQLTEKEAIAWAIQETRGRFKVCLTDEEGRNIWIGKDGNVQLITLNAKPSIRIGDHRVEFQAREKTLFEQGLVVVALNAEFSPYKCCC